MDAAQDEEFRQKAEDRERAVAEVNQLYDDVTEYANLRPCSHCGSKDWAIIREDDTFGAVLSGYDFTSNKISGQKILTCANLVCDVCGSVWLISMMWFYQHQLAKLNSMQEKIQDTLQGEQK